MLAVVSRTQHRDYWAVARDPYARTLAAFGAYEDVERIERVVGEFRAIAEAVRVNHAMNAPERLQEAHDALLARYTARSAFAELMRDDPTRAANAIQALVAKLLPGRTVEVS